jgi:hypothetical protein
MNNMVLFDFARCRCGFPTPIRPSKIVPPGESRKSLETGDETIVVACKECKRVFMADQLKSETTLWGLAPYNPEAPMRVFRVPIECDELNCSARLLVHVMLRSDTTDAELEKEKVGWRWAEGDLTCDLGHILPWPPWE